MRCEPLGLQPEALFVDGSLELAHALPTSVHAMDEQAARAAVDVRSAQPPALSRS